jgi:hypothetical protein
MQSKAKLIAGQWLATSVIQKWTILGYFHDSIGDDFAAVCGCG